MTDRESHLREQLFGDGQQSKGPLTAMKEAVLAVAPGLRDFGPEVTSELKHLGSHGAHELAAALFSGQAFVMYPRSPEEPSHHQAHDTAAPDQDGHDHHLERGGRHM